MKALTIIFTFVLSITTWAGKAQTDNPKSTANILYGNVFDQDGENLIGATIQWEGTTIGTITDENGNFWLPKQKTNANLLIQYVGYNPLLVEMTPEEDSVFIKVEGVTDLETVQVTGHGTDNFTSTLDVRNQEHISSNELKKAACCNLAESFETNGAVDVMSQDAVTSAKEIQMLGLRGVYSQLMMEKRPTYTGLATPLALDFIPGTWVQGIQISKGASTVQNGPQAITGQINTELVKPFNDKPFFLNIFGSTLERGEANLHLNHKWNQAWSSGLLLHGSTTQGKFDRNKDTFLDQPTKKSLNGLFRTFYRGGDIHSQFNVQALVDERESGQVLPGGDYNPADFYRIRQENRRVDVFGKLGYLGFAKPETSLGFIYNATWHNTDNVFGKTSYKGTQKSLYANLIYASFLSTTDHKINLGASFQLDDYDEFLDEADFSRRETMPGVFAEYSFGRDGAVYDNFWDRFGLIAGLRLDYHNINGTFLTPRLNLKYNFSDRSILRLSGGRGVRSAQVISENIAVLASNRRFVVTEDLKMEDAWNTGLNFTQNLKLAGRNASFVADLYRTNFTNQVVMDMESEHGKVLFYNLDGKSYANSLLLLGTWEMFKGFNLKLAYKLNDVKTTYHPPSGNDNGLRRRPLTAPHRALAALDYETPNKNWMFNTNIQYTGWQRFADAGHIPTSIEDKKYFDGYSPAYVLINAQVTRRFKQWEIYLGGENLTDYRQEHAIVDWQNPFGEHFDAMQVWGPLVGARGYVGIRVWVD
ncbi:MAG: TonB-dependent receptor [Lewinellaceae bacterium]|nr:TonB-dependent receptor [Saprospiraceae bacterium]MCB9341409.1 TonB-dependent receptor [Lewinellaceae bacterium]